MLNEGYQTPNFCLVTQSCPQCVNHILGFTEIGVVSKVTKIQNAHFWLKLLMISISWAQNSGPLIYNKNKIVNMRIKLTLNRPKPISKTKFISSQPSLIPRTLHSSPLIVICERCFFFLKQKVLNYKPTLFVCPVATVCIRSHCSKCQIVLPTLLRLCYPKISYHK